MLTKLQEIILDLQNWMLDDHESWDSLVINRRKPTTYRLFRHRGNLRVCLHRFQPCDLHEAFLHPHPWPAAFAIIYGAYEMTIGLASDRQSDPVSVANMVMAEHSSYQITNPLVFHSVAPLMPTYTVMVNGPEWDAEIAHKQVRRTKGKDLEKLPMDEVVKQLNTFKGLLIGTD